MDETCSVPSCGKPATVGEWREPFGTFRWGMHLVLTVEDIAFNWPLCAEHSDSMLTAAFDAVGAVLSEWGLSPGYKGLTED